MTGVCVPAVYQGLMICIVVFAHTNGLAVIPALFMTHCSKNTHRIVKDCYFMSVVTGV